MTKPTERPILFATPLVRAILAGEKTETRRPVKPQPGTELVHEGHFVEYVQRPDCWLEIGMDPAGKRWAHKRRSPFGSPGDLLWVRETFQPTYAEEVPDGRALTIGGTWGIPAYPDLTACAVYRADGDRVPHQYGCETARWCPSIHMPKWAARIWLRVEEVRVERLRDITEEGAKAEGVTPSTAEGASRAWGGPHRWAFMRLWSTIYGDDHITAGANPWVWACRFEVVSTTGRPE